MKAPQLSESDKRAVDMLLNELAQSSLDEAGFSVSSNVVNPKSLHAARMVLSRLEHLDAGEPASDLVTRCMARIDRAIRNGEIASPAANSEISNAMGARVDA